MPNTLTLNIHDKIGANLSKLFSDLADGLYSTSGAGTEFEPSGTVNLMTDASTMELRVDYATIGGEVQTSGFAGWDEGVAAVTATFTTPEPLGFGTWGTMGTTLFDGLLGDTRIKVTGNVGDDWASGFDFNDRFQMGNGNDAAMGGAGNDVLLGGRGRDLLIGGADDDRLIGGKGRDMLIAGPGDDTVKGGAGNDVLVLEGGDNTVDGGKGHDIFILETFQTAPPGTGSITRSTWAAKWDPDDTLVFAGFSVSPDTIDPSSQTLQDVDNGTIDEFRWFQQADNLVIRAGDAKVILQDTTANQVDLDMILFTEQTAAEATTLFDSASSGGTLGTPPGGDPYLTITMTNWTRVGDGTTSFDSYGGDLLGFITFGQTGGI